MSLLAHVSMRTDFHPKRVDNIFNRKRARNIKNLSKSIVPRVKHFSQDFFQAKENYLKKEIYPTKEAPAKAPTNLILPLIDSKKPNFEVYLNRTSHLSIANRNRLQAEIKGFESAKERDEKSVKSQAGISPNIVPSAGKTFLVPPDPHKHIRDYLNQQPNNNREKVILTLAPPSITSPGIRLTTPSPPLLRHSTSTPPKSVGEMNGRTSYRKTGDQIVINSEADNFEKNRKKTVTYSSEEQKNGFTTDRTARGVPTNININNSLTENKINNSSTNKDIRSSLPDTKRKSLPREDDYLDEKGSRRQSVLNSNIYLPEKDFRRQSVQKTSFSPLENNSRRQSVLKIDNSLPEQDSRRQSILDTIINPPEEDSRRQSFIDAVINPPEQDSRRQSVLNSNNNPPEKDSRRQSVLNSNNNPPEKDSRRQSVLNSNNNSLEKDSRRQSVLNTNNSPQEKDSRRQSVLNSNINSPENESRRQSLLKTEIDLPEKDSSRLSPLKAEIYPDKESRRLSVRKMSSNDSGYAAEPTKSMDKSDSVDISEIEAEYFRNVHVEAGAVTSFPLYVNKLAELFSNKRNFAAFLKTEFRNVSITSVIEAARGYVITASKEDIQFLKSKLPLVIPGGCSVHEMTGSEEVGTFYLILKPVPEDITISAVMRVLIERQFPVRKIKRISNKVTKERTKVVVVTLESTHKKLLKILEDGSVKIGEHIIRAFLLYPSGRTGHFNHPPLRKGSDSLDGGQEDGLEGSPQTEWRLGNATPSTIRLDSSDSTTELYLPDQNEVERNSPLESSQSPSNRSAILCPSSESTVYSAIERMLVASKTGMHPTLQYSGDTNKYNGSTSQLDLWAPTSEIDITGGDIKEEVSKVSPQYETRRASDVATSLSEVAPNDTLTALSSTESLRRGNDEYPPPKPKRTSKITKIENSLPPKCSNILEGESESCNESDEVHVVNGYDYRRERSSMMICAESRPVSRMGLVEGQKRTVSVQYEKPPPDLSELLVDEEDTYFCSLEGIVTLLKERPSSEETEKQLEKVRQANLNRSTYGMTHVEPGKNEAEDSALKRYVQETKRRSDEEKSRKDVEDNMSKKSGTPLPPSDTFNFGDIMMGKTKEDILTDKVPAGVLSTLMKNTLNKSHNQLSNCVTLSEKKSLRRKNSKENFSVANNNTNYAGAEDKIRASESMEHSDVEPRDNIVRRKDSTTQVIVTSNRKLRRQSVLQNNSTYQNGRDNSKAVKQGNNLSNETEDNNAPELSSKVFANKEVRTSTYEMSARDRYRNSNVPSFNQEEDEDIQSKKSNDSINTLSYPVTDTALSRSSTHSRFVDDTGSMHERKLVTHAT